MLLFLYVKSRSSRPKVFYKKRVLRNFAKFTGIALFLIKLQTEACVLLSILRNF